MCSKLLLPALLGCALLTASASSQSADARETTSKLVREPRPPVTATSAGFTELDGQIWAGGPAYKALLGVGEIVFTPALGQRVESNQTLTLRLDSLRRDQGPVRSVEHAAKPHLDGTWVEYDHGQGLSERYQSRAEELEQVLVLDAPLAGSGDLVVRYAIATELELEDGVASGARVAFERPGVGGVRIDKVLGIDARGASASGSLRVIEDAQQDWLEIVLPAGFVESAQFPLVIDPAFGPQLEVGGTGDNSNPDVMTEQTSGTSLVVWQTQFSLSDIDVRGQRLDYAGGSFGPLLSIEPSVAVAQHPAVAARNVDQRWIVAYETANFFAANKNLAARSIDSATGTITASTTIVSGAGDNSWPTLGNDHPAALNQLGVLLAWRNGSSIKSVALSLDPSNLVLAGPQQTLATLVSASTKPRISGTGGYLGLWMVVWEAPAAIFSADTAVFGAILDRNNTLVKSSTLLASSTGLDLGAPAVDADQVTPNASNFLVAYEQQEAVGSVDHDIYLLSLHWNGSALTTNAGPTVVEGTPNDDEIQPAVACASTKVFVAFADQSSDSQYDIYVEGLNYLNCSTCETKFLLDAPLAQTPRDLRLRTQGTSPTPTYGRSFLVWSQYNYNVPYESSAMVQPLDTVAGTGTSQDLGGGCGGGGTVDDLIVSGPAIGDPGYGLRNVDADPLASFAILNISATGVTPIVCGTCQFLPYQFTLSTGKVDGGFGLLLPIPCDAALVGQQFDAQWTVLPTVSSPCFLAANISISNIARMTIGN